MSYEIAAPKNNQPQIQLTPNTTPPASLSDAFREIEKAGLGDRPITVSILEIKINSQR
jgi:hypothetical protein